MARFPLGSGDGDFSATGTGSGSTSETLSAALLAFLDARFVAQNNPNPVIGQLSADILSTNGVPGPAGNLVIPANFWGILPYVGPPVNPGPRADGTWQTDDLVIDRSGAWWVNIDNIWTGGGGGVTPPPSIVSSAASPLAQTTATLNGSVNPNDNPSTTYQFEYGTTTAYGTLIPGSPGMVGSNNQVYPLSANLTGLTAATLYHWRLNAISGGVTTRGADQTFTTLVASPLPSVTVNGPFGITQTSANVNASINPNGSSTTYMVVWGLTTGYGNTIGPGSSIGSDNTVHSCNTSIAGLTAGTTYHYQFSATNANGTTTAADQTFTTAAGAAPGPVTPPVIS